MCFDSSREIEICLSVLCFGTREVGIQSEAINSYLQMSGEMVFSYPTGPSVTVKKEVLKLPAQTKVIKKVLLLLSAWRQRNVAFCWKDKSECKDVTVPL